MISSIVIFLFLLNPFGLFLYLGPVMKSLTNREFREVLLKASIISFMIFLVFAVLQDFLFDFIFDINFNSFRVFGGIIIFSIAYLFIMKGEKAFIQLKGSLMEIANQVALPYMVGAATISLVILMSEKFTLSLTILMLAIILAINHMIIMGMKFLRESLETRKHELVFDRMMDLLLRLNGFFLGAMGIDMVVSGIFNLSLLNGF